jgi:hypothetical protein
MKITGLSLFESCRKLSEVDNPLSREIGTAVLLLINPKPEFNIGYQKELAEKRLE